MLNPPYGLRFDIYERVQLPEDVPAIAQLEEIELYPRIQVITDQEHAALRGHLLLSGVYVGENQEQEGLQHLIPVEITIPLSRVASVEEIAVEIENFDVDLLSTRSLNITGVLSLRGIEGIRSEEAAPVWNPEEFTVVHSNSAEQGSSISEYADENPYVREPAEGITPSSYEQNQISEPSPIFPESPASPESPAFYASYTAPSSSYEEAQEERDMWKLPYETLDVEEASNQQEITKSEEQPSIESPIQAQEPQAQAQEPQARVIQDSEPRDYKIDQSASPEKLSVRDEEKSESAPSAEPEVWQFEAPAEPAVSQLESAVPAERPIEEPVGESAEEPVEIQRENQEISWEDEGALLTTDVPQPEAEEEKPELKIAFGTKKSDVAAPDSYGIKSLLQTKRTEEVLQLEEQIPIEKREEAIVEDGQWKNLFLGSTSEQTPFKKVKLCIVQREETLETIAGRYQLSTRELQLYNRLSEQAVEEGQVLYIP